MNLSDEEFQRLSDQLSAELCDLGFEIYPFKIQWYNQMVSQKFQLQFDDNCIGFVIISTPDMFENAFIPYLKNHWSDKDLATDPIDECMKYYLNRLKSRFSQHSVEVIHDFEILPTKRPKVLVQTAAHVSGAAYYYKSDLNGSDKSGQQLGVCIHPVFGGWFAMRGVVIFSDLTANSLQQKQPKDVVSTDKLKELIIKFNYHWEDWSYRDVIPVQKRYSDLQKKYFSLKPSERKLFIKELLNYFDFR